MAHAIRYHRFGGPEVLEVEEVPTPEPGEREVLVEVFATGLNPMESLARRGQAERGGDGFPRGQGRDLAGIVARVGPGAVAFARGDPVMGWVEDGAQASYAAVPEDQLLRKPASVPWEVAGSLATAGTMAWDAVEGLALRPGDTVVVTAAAGGVGCLAAQLARLRGATVIGTSAEQRRDFLAQFGIIPLAYGSALADRVRAVAEGRPVTAFLDFLGGEAPEAIALGVPSSRILTVLDRDAVDEHGVVPVVPGDLVALRRVVALVADHRIRLPIADVFPLERAGDAYRALDRRDAPGKIVIGLRVVHYDQQRVHEPELKEQDVTLGVATPHGRIDVEESIPPVIGDGRVRARHRAEREERARAAGAQPERDRAG